jgi:hypothetical protein
MRGQNTYAQLGHQTISTVKDKEQAKRIPEQKLKKAIKASNQVLISIKTVFPLTLFQDTVTVDRAKLTITRRQFFQMSEVMSIRLEDILNVTATAGPFFGSLTITNRIQGGMGDPIKVDRLWRDDALKLKRILQGYVIALQKKIDCSELSTGELAEMLDRIGQDDHPGS